ncbi:MAG: HYExAFE family protein [Phycisphaeraceae bacterium]|nr:HYExAFE family protein [Phycisphaeraceae bacterium]MCB9847127.1 HYExAFE family protein [Phycisphaeraceae bacterium]
MGQYRSAYERAFEGHLRGLGVPYVSVNEARRALLPEGARLSLAEPGPDHRPERGRSGSLKTFDFVVYGPRTNLLVDVKGRKIGARRAAGSCSPGRLESWVTEDDVASLGRWESVFGEGFRSAFVFLYRCEAQPPAALFQEVFEHQGRWYAVRAVWLDVYRESMVRRSARWRTVHIPTALFESESQPLCAVVGATAGDAAGAGSSLQAATGCVSSSR